MKKKQTNTLDSWIDQSELQRLADALAPTDKDSADAPAVQNETPTLTEQASSIGLPKKTLDINQPTAYRAAAFPHSNTLPAAEATTDAPAAAASPSSPSLPESASSVAKQKSPEIGQADKGPVLRAARALAEVRLRAEENGFLKRHATPSPAGVPHQQVMKVPPALHVLVSPENALSSSVATASSAKLATESELSDFEIPQGPLRSRLESFVTWAMPLVQASRLVIVDGEGYTLLHRDLQGGSDESSSLADSAMRLTSVLEQVQARSDFARDGALNLPLEEGGWLGVLRCESAGGHLCIAVVTPAPLEVEKTARLKVKLAQTMKAGFRAGDLL